MTKISNQTAYPLDTTITDADYVIGTDADNLGKITRNFSVGNLRDYILSGLSPVEGGTLRISEIAYTGVLTTPEDVVNALDPDYEVLAYHLVFINVNGQQFLLKLQDRFIGATQDAVTNEDFIEFPVSVGPTGENGVDGENGADGVGIESIELTNTVGLVKTYTITLTNSNTFDFNVSDGEQGEQGDIGPAGADGVSVIADGISTTVEGDGSIGDPYQVNLENLQKVIDTFPYTLLDGDNKHTIFIDNGVSDVVINVPDGLVDNFCCSFYQEGTGEVTIQQYGTATLLYPSTILQNKIKGLRFWAMVEKKLATDTYALIGSLKLI
jgi:hypothetical protein